MLFSARKLADIVENLYFYEEKNDNQVSKQLRLKTVWEHPKSNLKSSVLDIAPAKDSHCFVSLPSYLVDYVDIDSRTEGEVQLLEAQIIEFLKDIKNYLPKQRCTVAKLACCIKQLIPNQLVDHL
jgi:Trm5-related predicted tRNA methylase